MEQERLKLEEVVKMEIKARMGAVGELRAEVEASVAGACNRSHSTVLYAPLLLLCL